MQEKSNIEVECAFVLEYLSMEKFGWTSKILKTHYECNLRLSQSQWVGLS